MILFDRTNLASQKVNLPVFLLDDNSKLKGEKYQVSVSVLNDHLDTVYTEDFISTGEDTVKKLGEISLNRQFTKSSILFFLVDIIYDNRCIYRNYYFTNYEVCPGSILSMPKTDAILLPVYCHQLP